MSARRKKRYTQIIWVATLVAIGLYLAASTRLVGSGDWNDHVATRLSAFAMIGTALVMFLSIFGQEPAATRGPRKRWTNRRIVVRLAIACPLLAGAIWSMINSGTLMGQLMCQMTAIAVLLILAWSSTAPQRQ
ncbi:hypothetical protein [Nocardia sp. CS682]|uniref:hypothetical protein n=1 Tax=Nocardia sp. CS682 TaxID=1047172 RepID=UPI001074EDF1|nr:hypothetical protein [Nocardia sp. CS682]QBS45311.1 hypothetical protein DMB37_39770 [Nocardia sp. CS682]